MTTTIDIRGVKHLCWIVASSLRATGLSIDIRHFTMDNTPVVVALLSPGEYNIPFTANEESSGGSDLTSFRIIIAIADQEILVVERLYVDYGL